MRIPYCLLQWYENRTIHWPKPRSAWSSEFGYSARTELDRKTTLPKHQGYLSGVNHAICFSSPESSCSPTLQVCWCCKETSHYQGNRSIIQEPAALSRKPRHHQRHRGIVKETAASSRNRSITKETIVSRKKLQHYQGSISKETNPHH